MKKSKKVLVKQPAYGRIKLIYNICKLLGKCEKCGIISGLVENMRICETCFLEEFKQMKKLWTI